MATPLATFNSSFNPLPQLQQMGFRPTSGFRTQRHQDALRAQGLTSTSRSHHTTGDALDLAVPSGMSKEQAMATIRQMYPGARVAPTNGNAIHVTFPGWQNAPDVSGSRRRYGD